MVPVNRLVQMISSPRRSKRDWKFPIQSPPSEFGPGPAVRTRSAPSLPACSFRLSPVTPPSLQVRKVLEDLAKEQSFRDTRILSYAAPREPVGSKLLPESLRRAAPWPDGIHAVFGRHTDGEERAAVRLLIVQTCGGQVISFSQLHRK